MSRRKPGTIANRTHGIRKRKHIGWRDFRPVSHPNVVDDSPNNFLASIAETGGNIVATYATTCTTASQHIQEYDAFVIPLTNNYGEPINFNEPFSLMTQIEFISATGDHSGSSEPELAFGLGICENEGGGSLLISDESTNKWLGSGLSQNNDSTPPDHNILQGKSYSTSGTRSSRSAAMGGPTGLSHASYFVGPAVGSNADAESVGVVAVAGAYSGGSYAKDGTVTTDAYDLSNDAATIQNDGQVYLFAWIGSYNSAWDYSASGTPPVLTCRLRYMVSHDPTGWGGSGS